jgi:hypothetical protein
MDSKKDMRAHLIAAAGLLVAILVLGVSGKCRACPIVLGGFGLLCVALGVLLLLVLTHMAWRVLGAPRRAVAGRVFLKRPSMPLLKPKGGAKAGNAAAAGGGVADERVEAGGEAEGGEAGAAGEAVATAAPGSVFLRRTTRSNPDSKGLN